MIHEKRNEIILRSEIMPHKKGVKTSVNQYLFYIIDA